MTTTNPAYAFAGIKGALADFEREASPGNINIILFKRAARCYELANAGGGDTQWVESELERIAAAAGHPARQIAGTLASARKKVGMSAADVPAAPHSSPSATKRPKPSYARLADYATAHDLTADDLARWGWKETMRWAESIRTTVLAFSFPTPTGTRYRYADEDRAGRKYDSDRGYQNCWYGRDEAITLAQATSQPLVLGNGEVSTITAQARGVPACCITGGEKTKIPTDLLAELLAVWNGPILLAYDCDPTGRAAAFGQLAQLRAAGYAAEAKDLGGSDGYDLADFARLNPTDTMAALVRCPSREIPGTPDAPTAQAQAQATSGPPTIISARDLMDKVFPPIRWIVPNILAEGLTILGGPPKLGKSALALTIALDCARGGLALGMVPVEKIGVLYLDLENGERRVQDRLGDMLKGAQAPDGLAFAAAWDRTDQLGIVYLDGYLSSHPDCKLVVIDTLAKIRPGSSGRGRLYDDDYGPIDALHALTLQYSCSIVVIHHTGKSDRSDFIDRMSGSTGLTAGADAVMVLERDRGKADACLKITGRDIGEAELALKSDFPLWTLLGKAEFVRQSDERTRVIDAVRNGATTPKAILEELQLDEPELKASTLRTRLFKMVKSGVLENGSSGYRVGVLFEGNAGNAGNAGNTPEQEFCSVTLETPALPYAKIQGNAGNAQQDALNAVGVTRVTRVTSPDADDLWDAPAFALTNQWQEVPPGFPIPADAEGWEDRAEGLTYYRLAPATYEGEV